MTLEEFSISFEIILKQTLTILAQRLCVDKIRAVHVGYDTFNGYLELSLLTDREKIVGDGKGEPYGSWVVGEWRYYNATQALKSNWSDAQDLIDWMTDQARSLSTEAFNRFDDDIAEVIKRVVLGQSIQTTIRDKFMLAQDFETRVEACID
jgi:hypothetical protein